MNNKKKLVIQEYELPVSIQEEKEGGFVAVCSVWQDCYAQGETVEEVINEISQVASSLIELYKEKDLKIPLTIKRSTDNENKKFSINLPLNVSIK